MGSRAAGAMVLAVALAGGCKPEADGPKAKDGQPAPPVFDEPEASKGTAEQDLGAAYAAAMDELADTIVAKTRAAADADYETFEDAQGAMLSCLPQASLSKLDEVLAREGIEQAAMVEYMKAHPEQVQQVGARFQEKLAKVEPDLARLIAKVATLAPPEQRERVQQQLAQLGYGSLAEPVQWRSIDDVAALQAAFAVARAQGHGVFVDVRAEWCMPCKQLEEQTLRDPAVRSLLQTRYLPVRFDVTDPQPPARALQEALGAQELPMLAVWDAEAVRKASPSLQDMPPPSHRIGVFVEPAELLETLGVQGR